jgi:aspartyl-tRNA(Asn)/glutamyl-tRNA(Gln) amidotransferase subunit C
MAPKLTRDEVLRIATLAHLELTDSEIDLFSRQLADILTHVAVVQEADTGGVTPTAHPLPVETVWRDDEVRPGLDRDAVLEQAPDADRTAGLFRVPKVLKE